MALDIGATDPKLDWPPQDAVMDKRLSAADLACGVGCGRDALPNNSSHGMRQV
jgi:hypothetical protein